MNSTCVLGLISGLLMAGNLRAAQPTEAAPVICACDKPFMFGFGSWEKAKETFPAKADGIHIHAQNGQGGAGIAGLNVAVAGHGDWSPTLKAKERASPTASASRCHSSTQSR